MLNIKIKIDFVVCAVTQKVVFSCWFIFIAQKGLWSHKLKMISMLYNLWIALKGLFQAFALFSLKRLSR